MLAGQTIFVLKPVGWTAPGGADGEPAFWFHQPPPASSGLRHGGLPVGPLRPRVDFPLRKSATTGSDLDVLVFADPQPKSHTDIDHYRRDIVEPLRGTSAALGLTLGDIVDDDRSEEHTYELQSLMRISYAAFCLT